MKVRISSVSVAGLVLLAACASVKSTQAPPHDDADGLTYFMPKKDFTVTVTVIDKNPSQAAVTKTPKADDAVGDKSKAAETGSATGTGKSDSSSSTVAAAPAGGPAAAEGTPPNKGPNPVISKVVFGTTPAYPDTTAQYVLQFSTNMFGKNTLDVAVGESGLLQSTKTSTTTNIADAFKSLASLAGTATTLLARTATLEPPKPCPEPGDYIFVVPMTDVNNPLPGGACGLSITIKRLFDEKTPKIVGVSEATHTYSGIFYRQNLPYLLTAKGPTIQVSSVVFSPSESPVHVLPVSRTLFSSNAADFDFVDGVPKNYKQDTDGDVVALLKLPADIIGAYFSAIGNMFDSFKANDNKEAAALSESLKLELAKKKYDACIAAITAKDDAQVKTLACQQ